MVRKFNIEGAKHPCVLLAALDWGLGHATRCIPIIRFLIENKCEVIIAAEGKQKNLLQLEFPTLQFADLKGYRLQYSNNRWKTIVKIITQIPKIFRAVRYEHRWLKQFAKQKRIDAVISDNRYGFYLRKVPSVLVTHQLNIQTPFKQPGNMLVNMLNYRAIQAFDSCWVPDLAGVDNFGGALSHPPVAPAILLEYIGPLTRFTLTDSLSDPELVVVLISGPEPQRTIFEEKILKQAIELPKQKRVIVVRGLPGETDLPANPGNLSIYNHLLTEELGQIISKAGFIVSRPGYSTVMEMLSAGKKCLFIPTPGQSEQEYLGVHLAEKNYCVTAEQDDFSLVEMLGRAEKMEPGKLPPSKGLLEKVLTSFLQKLPSQ